MYKRITQHPLCYKNMGSRTCTSNEKYFHTFSFFDFILCFLIDLAPAILHEVEDATASDRFQTELILSRQTNLRERVAQSSVIRNQSAHGRADQSEVLGACGSRVRPLPSSAETVQVVRLLDCFIAAAPIDSDFNSNRKMDGLVQALRSLSVRDLENLNRDQREILNQVLRHGELARVDAHFAGRDRLSVAREAVRRLRPDVANPDGLSLTACSRHLQGVFINIFDYVRGDDQVYQTRGELRQRCKALKAQGLIGFYSKDDAKSEGLRFLLKHLF